MTLQHLVCRVLERPGCLGLPIAQRPRRREPLRQRLARSQSHSQRLRGHLAPNPLEKRAQLVERAQLWCGIANPAPKLSTYRHVA
eukprot:3066611-Prymnesium_polylepis.1